MRLFDKSEQNNDANTALSKRIRRNLLWLSLLAIVWFICSAGASAETLRERQQAFPNWQSKPPVQLSDGDLFYPKWMEGTWRMNSTLVDMVAPFAPDLVTPGFEGNRQFLDKPIPAFIRFVPKVFPKGSFLNQPIPKKLEDADADEIKVVSDRAFNGLNLAKAYLGDEWVKAVKVDPNDPNRQVTFLKDNQQLVSTVTGRTVETPNNGMFATTEVFQQFFRNPKSVNSESLNNRSVDNNSARQQGTRREATVYLNEVENTTIYRKRSDPNFPLEGDQITAIYLSPQDPNYFKAKDKPVALYRYHLSFSPVRPETLEKQT
ncbi:MAG: DUF6816 family protein [Phormidesmis sp.]